jgi:hypothetical protein
MVVWLHLLLKLKMLLYLPGLFQNYCHIHLLLHHLLLLPQVYAFWMTPHLHHRDLLLMFHVVHLFHLSYDLLLQLLVL